MIENNLHNICVICGREYTGYGNNSDPVTDGCCCDECNRLIVIPSRIRMYENLSKDE